MTKKNKKFDFENSLKELESIVACIEQGEIGLEESLDLFTKGVEISKKCQQTLAATEQKVKILTENNLKDFTYQEEQKQKLTKTNEEEIED